MHTHQTEHSIAVLLRSEPVQLPIFAPCWRESGLECLEDGRGAEKGEPQLERRGYLKQRSRNQYRQISNMPIPDRCYVLAASDSEQSHHHCPPI